VKLKKDLAMRMDTSQHAQTSVSIEVLRANGQDRFLNFFRDHLPAYHRFVELWNWRKDGLPASGGETAVIARYRDDIVGVLGIVPVRLTISGRSIQACWQQDSLVSPAMRGKGVGKKLVEEAAKNFDMVMAKGTSDAMYRLRKKLGFQDVMHGDLMIRVLQARPDKTVDSKTRIAEWLLLGWGSMVHAVRHSKAEPTETVSPICRFGSGFDTVAQRCADRPVVRPWKDSNYLNWRYCCCPGRSYRILQHHGSDRTDAMVLNCTGKLGDEGWIVDCTCSPEGSAGFSSLLARGLREFRTSGVRRVYAFATHPVIRRRLRHFGFVSTGRSPRFTYRTRSGSELNAYLSNHPWDFWHGDGDVELYP
jgi:GNAT superfamily N-acetyltransferase